MPAGCGKEIELMNSTDLRPAYSPRQLDLLTEAFECVGGGCYAVTDCLESDGAELQVFRFIHLAHTAFADRANNAKTPKNELAWLKASAPVIQKSVEVSKWSVKRSGSLLFGLEKLFKVHLQFEIPAADRVYKCRTILRVLLQGGMK